MSHMAAILFMIGTKYSCNDSHDWDKNKIILDHIIGQNETLWCIRNYSIEVETTTMAISTLLGPTPTATTATTEETILARSFPRSMPQSVDCQSKNIIPIRFLSRHEYKQLTPCSNFQFFLPDNLSRYIESSEFSAENVLRQDFIGNTNLTQQESGPTD